MIQSQDFLAGQPRLQSRNEVATRPSCHNNHSGHVQTFVSSGGKFPLLQVIEGEGAV